MGPEKPERRKEMSTTGEISKLIEQLYTIDRIISAMQKRPHEYNGVTLYANEAHTLKMIAQNEGISQMELSERMFRTKGATSMVVDKLVCKGLVDRRRENSDQRRYLLTLTPLGKAAHEDHISYDDAHARKAAQELALNEDQLKALNQAMVQVIQFYAANYLDHGRPVAPRI